MRTGRTAIGTAVIAIIAVVVIIVGAMAVITLSSQSSTSNATLVTTTTIGIAPFTSIATSVNTTADVYLTSCSITGIAELALRVVSDSTGAPVSGETLSAVDTLGCDTQTQVVHIGNFSMRQGGWLTPVFPAQAEPGGN